MSQPETESKNNPSILLEQNIVMVGPTGVGKTSMLASMAELFRKTLRDLGYTTDIPLEWTKKLRELEDLGKNGHPVIPKELQLQNSDKMLVYPVVIRESWKQDNFADMKVNFVDVPGGWYQEGDGHYDEACKLLRDANVSFWCIDSVSMMQQEGKYHNEKNAPQRISELYKNNQLQDGHCIIFVLMRAETYVRNGGNDNLRTKFLTSYNNYRKEIERIQRKQIQCFYCDVRTLGNVIFNNYTGDKAEFMRVASEPYSPQNCEVPVLLAVQHLTEMAKKPLEEIIERYEYYPIIRFFIKKYNRCREIYQKIDEMQKTISAEIDVHRKAKNLVEL